MRASLIVIASLASLGLVGCLKEMEDMSEVTKLRVLAFEAEPPEVRPGEGMELTAHYADPTGDGREVEFAWIVCPGVIPPETGLTLCEPLFPPMITSSFEEGHILSIPETPPELLLQLREAIPDMSAAKVTAVVILCAGGRLPEGGELLARMDDTPVPSDICAGGEGEAASRTVVISESENPNRNPVLASFRIGEERVDLRDTDALETGVTVTHEKNTDGEVIQEAVEMGVSFSSTGDEGTTDERLYVTWFSDAGEFSEIRSGEASEELGPFEVEWTPPEEPGEHTLYIAGHDTRGGVDFVSLPLSVRE